MSEINGKLLSAVENGKLENVKDLINQYGLDNSEGYDSLCKSIILNHKEITKLLLSSGCRVDSNRLLTNTPLHFAVQNGDIEIVELLLNNKADVYAKNEDNWNPFLSAVSIDSEEIVDLLLRRGPYLKNNPNWISPLPVAIEQGLHKMAEKLLKLGTPVNIITCHSGKKCSPLYLAAKMCGRDCSIVELLLKHGADVNSSTPEGLKPIHAASAEGNVKIIKLLLRSNSDVNAVNNNMLTPLYLAVNNSQREAAKCLMHNGANVDAEFKNVKTVLNLAVSKKQSKIVEDILKHCPDTNNISNKISLKIAVKKSYDKIIVNNLLQYGFSIEPVDINDTVLVHNAIKEGYFQIIQDLVKHGLDMACNMEDNYCTVLHIAANYRQVEIARLFLTHIHGLDVNATDKAGKTAIQYSIQKPCSEMIKLLLFHGAYVQKSPGLLRFAIAKGWKELVEILLKNDVDIETTYEDGMTALLIICTNVYFRDRKEILKLLLSSGANVNARTIKERKTALHIACQNYFNSYVVKLLIEHKADVNSRDSNGQTPLSIALKNLKRSRNEEIVKILINAGSDINI